MICRYDSTRMASSPLMATEIGRASPMVAEFGEHQHQQDLLGGIGGRGDGVGGEHGQRDPPMMRS